MNKNKGTKTIKQYVGSKAEDAAVKALEERGFNILRRNYAVHNTGEIDIIAEKCDDIYVFEVRARMNKGTFPGSEESVDDAKRKKVINTARHFIAAEDLYDRNVVFEVIKVTHDAQCNILTVEFVPF